MAALLPHEMTDREIVDALAATLADPEGRTSMVLHRGTQVGREEMLGHWSVMPPDAPAVHRVAIVRLIDGEAAAFEHFFDDERTAKAVYEHVKETFVERVSKQKRR